MYIHVNVPAIVNRIYPDLVSHITFMVEEPNGPDFHVLIFCVKF